MERSLQCDRIIEAESVTLTREDELQLEVDRLRMRLDRAHHDMKLMEERASLQRIHIAQLQNQLGMGVCRETKQPTPHIHLKSKHTPKRLAKAAPFDPERAKKGLCQNPYCSEQTNRKYCTQSCAMKHRWDSTQGD